MISQYNEKVKPEWTPWFAWHRVPIGGYPLRDGATMVWLQWVERRWLDSREGSSRYNYRLKGSESNYSSMIIEGEDETPEQREARLIYEILQGRNRLRSIVQELEDLRREQNAQ